MHAADESPYSFQTEAANLLTKGLNSYLSRFDVLQAKLKSKKLEKQKPTPTEMEYIKSFQPSYTLLYFQQSILQETI